MHRIDNPTAVQILPAIAPVGLPGFFINGDPRRGRLSTRLDQDFFNAVQEEIAHVIEQAGLTLDKFRFDQLLLAILIHIQRGIPPFPDMPFLPIAGGTMQGSILQHIAPTVAAELTNKLYVDGRDNAVIAHSDAMDVHYHNEAVAFANTRAIQEGDRAQNNAWAWDQSIWERVNWIDQTQGGLAIYGSAAVFTVPGAARMIEVWTTGGGGGGGGNHAGGYAGGGGGAGGTAFNRFAVLPGQQFLVTVGGGGAGGTPGAIGGAGGASQFGDFLGATGGAGGAGSENLNPAGGPGGVGFGSGALLLGGYGDDGWDYRQFQTPGIGGSGGASFWGGGGRAATGAGGNGVPGQAYGSGGGAPYYYPGHGGPGAQGFVLIKWNR